VFDRFGSVPFNSASIKHDATCVPWSLNITLKCLKSCQHDLRHPDVASTRQIFESEDNFWNEIVKIQETSNIYCMRNCFKEVWRVFFQSVSLRTCITIDISKSIPSFLFLFVRGVDLEKALHREGALHTINLMKQSLHLDFRGLWNLSL
jgi:hypothetical protein